MKLSDKTQFRLAIIVSIVGGILLGTAQIERENHLQICPSKEKVIAYVFPSVKTWWKCKHYKN